MISPDDIKKIATLARLYVEEKELEKLSSDLESILGYVSELESLEIKHQNKSSENSENLINIMREDSEPHESGKYTESILKQAPRRKENYVVVKKIL